MELTKEKILENTDSPETLEALYQSNKKAFSDIIKSLHDQETNLILKYWYTRLFYKPAAGKRNVKKYLITALLAVFAWIPVRLLFLPAFYDNSYLIKAIPVICSLALSFYFLIKRPTVKNIILAVLPHILILLYLILLPDPEQPNSQSLKNAYYFSFVLLWFFILFAQSNGEIKKLSFGGFLETTGETIVWSTLFIIGGAVIVALSLSLFRAININADNFYVNNIVTLGLVASPFVSLLVIDIFDRVKLSVIIANIFLPIILISTVAFGILSLFTKTKPYENRDIFILYNVLMVIVLCILTFTGSNSMENKIINICSYMLPVIMIILDGITISAVIYRLNKYGITANKITLLGTNIVMMGHLVYITYAKFTKKAERNVKYLPLYFVWALCVVFVFPFVFKMG
jgi:hypothetical protein